MVNFSVSVPGAVRCSAVGMDRMLFLFASPSLWSTKEKIYKVELQHIVLSDQGKSGGNLGPER